MKAIRSEWVRKAEADYDVILLLLKSRKPGRFDIICCHCQQCIEKYIKGRLVEATIPFPDTYDLDLVLNLTLRVEPKWAAFNGSFVGISNWGDLLRDLGNDATPAESKDAVRICRRFRKIARASLGL